MSISSVLANMIGGDITLYKVYSNGARFIFAHPKVVNYTDDDFDYDVYRKY